MTENAIIMRRSGVAVIDAINNAITTMKVDKLILEIWSEIVESDDGVIEYKHMDEVIKMAETIPPIPVENHGKPEMFGYASVPHGKWETSTLSAVLDDYMSKEDSKVIFDACLVNVMTAVDFPQSVRVLLAATFGCLDLTFGEYLDQVEGFVFKNPIHESTLVGIELIKAPQEHVNRYELLFEKMEKLQVP